MPDAITRTKKPLTQIKRDQKMTNQLQDLKRVSDAMTKANATQSRTFSNVSPMRGPYRDSRRVEVSPQIRETVNEPRRPQVKPLTEFDFIRVETGESKHSSPMFNRYVQLTAVNKTTHDEQVISLGLYPASRDVKFYVEQIVDVLIGRGINMPVVY